MSEHSAPRAPHGEVLLALYDDALPQVYGVPRQPMRRPAIAEDLTLETFMAAVDAVRWDRVPNLTVAWLVGVARHKLVDHWRTQARRERNLGLVDCDDTLDDWDERLDVVRAREVLSRSEYPSGGNIECVDDQGLRVDLFQPAPGY